MSYRQVPQQQRYLPLKKRIQYLLARLLGPRLLKSQRLYFVTINGRRFKRLVLRDSYLAAEIERNLERFGTSPYFPTLIARHENEIWLEFIDGTPIDTADEHLAKQIAEFYAAVYTRSPEQVETATTPFPARLHRHLCFLQQVGVLSDEVYRDLTAAATRLTPPRVWIGFDYTDPVLKNFVRVPAGDHLCAVDVESLRSNLLIGSGIAKACVRQLGAFREVLLAHLAQKPVPDFQAYLPFVELALLAAQTQKAFLQRKWRFVRPTLFDRFRQYA
ncbi:MAG: hypothetical protein NZ578_03345 [Candidatus Binatia bacterium]|nr:hypothetical protein [Candidatus Binatia bacterium]